MSAMLRPFLPRHLVELLRGGLPEHGRVRRRPAALLCVDVVGFTSLTERLERKGREGAEEIARLVNAVFREPIRTIDDLGGSIVSFGGDAIFAMFTGRGRDARAVGAAGGLSTLLEGRRARDAGGPDLVVSRAVHSGVVHELHLAAGGVRHLVVGGPSVAKLARQLRDTPPGGTSISRSVDRRGSPVRWRRPSSDAVAPGRLRAYVDPRVAAALPGFRGASRVASIVFLQTRGMSSRALGRFFAALRRTLDDYEGVLLKTDLGPDGISWLCAFGIPVAHEDDPERAARACLELQASAPAGLALRAGLHVGPLVNVIVGSPRRKSLDVMGDVVNTAARVCALARWGDALATEAMLPFLAAVGSDDRGSHSVKGKAAPLRVHALSGVRGGRRGLRLTVPMFGRDAELARVAALIEAARSGREGAIAITGDAGSGKSRLKYEAARLARARGFRVHEGRARSLGVTAYASVAELLDDALGIPGAPPAERARLARDACRRLALGSVDERHVAALVGEPTARSGSGAAALLLAPSDVRTNTMIAIGAVLRALAEEAPRLVVLEDMQWADEPSRAAIPWILRACAGRPVVLMVIARGAAGLPSALPVLALGELGIQDTARLLAASLGDAPAPIVELVRSRAGGNPFYVEEVARHLLEAGVLRREGPGVSIVRELHRGELPGSLELLIAARLDRLEPHVRRIAQYGAVLGRTFRRPMIERMAGPGLAVGNCLEELAARELVFPVPQEPSTYVFKHALTRDVAYASLLAVERRRLHALVGELLERDPHHARARSLPELGYHWEQAGDLEKARDCFLRASRDAKAHGAQEEAESHARRSLALSADAARSEASQALVSILLERGRAAEAEVAAQDAYDEARAAGDDLMTARALGSLAQCRQARGRATAALADAEAALAIWRRLREPRKRAFTLMLMATILRELGRTEEAQRCGMESLALFRRRGTRPEAARAFMSQGNLDFTLGRYDEAASHYARASELAERAKDRWLAAQILCNQGLIEMERGAMTAARDHLEQALAAVRQLGSRRVEGQTLGNLGLLADYEERLEDAKVRHAEALAIHREVGNRRSEGVTIGNLASVHLKLGDVAHAAQLSRQAIAIHREVGNRGFEGHEHQNLAEAHRLLGDARAAEEHLEEALVIVREVGDRLDVAKVCCRRGLSRLSRGASAADDLAEAREIASELGIVQSRAGTGSELAKDIEALARAQARLEAGLPLVRGQAPEDLTEGQRRLLARLPG